mgnify:CR=1 FL=1
MPQETKNDEMISDIPGEIQPDLLLKIADWKNLFLGLFELSKDLVFILDEKGCIIAINKQGASSLDYTVEELLGIHFSDLITDDYLHLVTSSISLALKNEPTFFEASLTNKFEKVTKYQISIRTVSNGKKIFGLLGVGRNVTRLRKLESELNDLKPKLIEAERLIEIERSRTAHHKVMLNELNRMKSEFVSNISHELRTPLASIVGFSETIASDPNMQAEMREEFNSIILNEGKRLAKLINDVLDLSRMETGMIVLNKSTINICKVIQNVIQNNIKKANERNIIFTHDLPCDELTIEADEERLTQAFNEIIENSLKFTNPGGRIKVMLSNLFREVEIVFVDTGIGIPEKELPYVFQKFYRVNRFDSEIPGAGMGLVFVKQIVDLHKGLITIQSEPTKGTSVIIKLLKNYRD